MSLSIPLLTDKSVLKERWCMRQSVPSALETKPSGEQIKEGVSIVLATLPSKRSFHKLLVIAFSSLNANERFLERARDSWPD
jgi:hypothetical protein